MIISLIPLVHLSGAVIGAVMVVFNYRQSRTLTGSFFKTYYGLTILASFLLAVGFFGEYLVVNQPEGIIDSLMHVILLFAAAIYAIAIVVWPKEANKYLAECKKSS
ncbi:MAG: hypothetical protein M1471_00230 [Patescibacteria group bacterium]|nr:hypothetical protein [Patescibacteria group bacterium]